MQVWLSGQALGPFLRGRRFESVWGHFCVFIICSLFLELAAGMSRAPTPARSQRHFSDKRLTPPVRVDICRHMLDTCLVARARGNVARTLAATRARQTFRTARARRHVLTRVRHMPRSTR